MTGEQQRGGGGAVVPQSRCLCWIIALHSLRVDTNASHVVSVPSKGWQEGPLSAAPVAWHVHASFSRVTSDANSVSVLLWSHLVAAHKHTIITILYQV